MSNTSVISFNSTGITLAADVAMNYNSISGLTNLTASGTITSDTAITNTLTTSGVALNIKSDLVLFKGLDNTIYVDAHPGGVLFYTDVYMGNTLTIQTVLSFASLSGSTWVETAFVSGSTGNIEQIDQY